jgi:hypothetical protein
MNGTREGSSILFEYFVCLGAAGTGAGVRDGTTTVTDAAGGGLDIDLDMQARLGEIRRLVSSAQVPRYRHEAAIAEGRERQQCMGNRSLRTCRLVSEMCRRRPAQAAPAVCKPQ